jgi:flagellar motor switch protein FliM
MTEVLSDDQIETLVSRARDGGEVPTAAESRRRRPRRIREIDFSRPNKFSKEQQKRIERAHEMFCRSAATQLAAQLQAPAELEVINVTQHVWSGALADLPVPSVYAIIEVQPLGTRLLVSVELQSILRMIVRLLGGHDDVKIAPRELTEIELAMTRRIFGTLISELSLVWKELLGVDLHMVKLETALQSLQLVPSSDPSLAVTIEVRMEGTSSTLSVLIPHRSISTALNSLSAGQYGLPDGGELDATSAAIVRRSLSEVEVEVRAEVASVEMPIEEVVALKPGDVIRFGVPAASGVMLYADTVAIHRARPGRSEHCRAVAVLEQVEQSE